MIDSPICSSSPSGNGLRRWIVAAASWCAISAAQAQPVPSQPLRPALPPGVISGQQPLTPGERSINLEQKRFERELQQEEIDRALNQPGGSDVEIPPQPAVPDPLPEGNTGNSVTLSGVDLDFAGQRAPFNVDDVVSGYLDRPLDNKGVFEVIRLLTASLYEAGYITSNIALKQPAVLAGRLQLRVNWGRIKGWKINGQALESWRDRTMVGWAMPNWPDSILNIRDIDQAIENLNNGFKRATVEIVAAEETGYSYLDLTVQRTSWLRFSLGRDNSGLGVPGTGRDKYNLTLQTGDLLGINDSLTLFTGRRYFADAAHDGEKSYDMSYRIPLGYTRIDLQAGYSNYKNWLRQGRLQYQSAGNARSLGLRVTRTLYRDATSQFSVYGGLKTRQSKNYLNGTLLMVSSKHYSDGTLGVQWSKQVGRHALFTDLGWNRGLSINQGQYSAFSESGASGYASRVTGTVSWQASFAPADRLLVAQSTLGFQYSSQMLLNNYQITVGDEYTVRGYSRRTLESGDKGVYLSNTVSMPIQMPWLGGGSASIAPFVGLDAGVVKINAPSAPSVRLAGWSLGARFNAPYWSVAATYSKPMVVQADRPKTPVWYITTSINF